MFIFLAFISVTADNIQKLNALVELDLCSAGVEIFKNGERKLSPQLPDFQYQEKFSSCQLKVELVKEKIHANYFICDSWNTLLSYPERVLSPVKGVYLTSNDEMHSSEQLLNATLAIVMQPKSLSVDYSSLPMM